MIKNFEKTTILTSQNPESFLTFYYNSSDGAPVYITPSLDVSIQKNTLYINGLDMYNSSNFNYNTLILSNDISVASFYLFTQNLNDFDLSLRFTAYNNPGLTSVNNIYDVSVLNRPFIINSNNINIYDSFDPLLDNEISYLLLRTNPIFTGNITLNVDSSNNLYLDTFKVSDILSNKKYRKQKISGNSIFSGDVRTVFNTLPAGEIFRIDSENTLNISIPKTNLFDQYNTTYSYGAKLFEDDLYDDEYSILAPLWINSKLPDFFAIFRIDGVNNPETFNQSLSLDNLANKYLLNGNLIKSWSLKKGDNLGNYLNNHLNELLNIQSPLFLSLGTYDANTWYGVAIDKGIITGRSEIPYFFQKTIDNFTDMNAFISTGFQRNNLLCPNLINLQYSFNDNDVSTYSMHRYFGLYLSENQLYKIGYYSQNPDSSTVTILSLDGNDSSSFINSAIFDTSGNIVDLYKNRLFVLDDGVQLNRINNVNQINGTKNKISQYLNKIGNNIFSSSTVHREVNPFITLSINNLLVQGEHLRIINETQNEIWEILSVDTSCLSKGQSSLISSIYSSSGYPTVYRSVFSIDGSISDQVKAIQNAFDNFSLYNPSSKFHTGTRQENSISIILNDDANFNDEWKFQRITPQVLNDTNDTSSGFNQTETINNLSFFGIFNPSSNDYIQISFDASYGPINLEFWGNRNSIILDFYKPDNSLFLYNFDSSFGNDVQQYTYYQSFDDNWYRLIQPFVINTQSNSYDFNYVEDPLSLTNKYLVLTEHPIKTLKGGIWNAFNVYPLYISLMGINPVKDIDYTVYDSSTLNFKSEYWYKRDNDETTYELVLNTSDFTYITKRNSYSIISGTGQIEINGVQQSFNSIIDNEPFMFNTFDNSAYISSFVDNTIITYNVLEASSNYKSYINGVNEENINDYYVDSSIKNTLKYGLVAPVVSKWVGLGNDCRGNEFRLILKNIIDGSINGISSNYIPFIDSSNNEFYNNELSYPSYKYLSPGDRNWKDYVYYDINDVVVYNEDSSIKHQTLKELIFVKPFTDIFSKLVYSNNDDVKGTSSRSSIVYFNQYKNTIDTLINGLQLSINVQNFAKNNFNIKNYDRYKFSFISTASKNYDSNYPLEVIINENTKTILLIWYQGNDLLSYNLRNSSFLPGKSNLISSGEIYNPNESNIDFTGFYTRKTASLYSFVKTPFIINSTTLTNRIVNLFSLDVSFNQFVCSPYSQLNYNVLTGASSILNAFNQNFVNSAQNFIGTNFSYNTFDTSINYIYTNNLNTYGNNIINQGFKYSSNDNLYIDNTCNLNIFKSEIGRNNIMYYVIRGTQVYSNLDFSNPAFQIKLNEPRQFNNLYTYNGYFKPKFNNILEFSSNEDLDLINVTKKDFILNNTNLKSYNNIKQYWYNKVVDNVTSLDVSLANTINFISDFNVFKSQWDANYYIITDASQNNSFVDGFNATKEIPSFFGSKLIKLPFNLILSESDSTNSTGVYDSNKQIITLTYNLTQIIKTFFKNNTDFIQNWTTINNSGNLIDNYIINTIIPFYNISISKIKLNLFTIVDNTEQVISFNYINGMNELINQNFNSTLNYVNGDYIYTIIFNNIYKNNLKYYTKFNLFEI